MIDEQVLRELYQEKKKSTAEIAEILHCSPSRVVYALKSYGVQCRSLSEATYVKRNPNGDPFLIKKIETLEDAKLLGLGLGLYWGEGNKKNKNSIRLGNTNPRLINTFVDFLIKIFGIEKNKLRFGLQVFNDVSKKEALEFWVRSLEKFGINQDQFFKVTITPSRGVGTYREKSKFGVRVDHLLQ